MEVNVLAHKPSENTMGMRQLFTIPRRVLTDCLPVIFPNKALCVLFELLSDGSSEKGILDSPIQPLFRRPLSL